MNLQQIVDKLPIESVHLIAKFAMCGDLEAKWGNDAANLPDFELVGHLFTESGGGPRVLPSHWQKKTLGAFGQAVKRQNDQINRRLKDAGLLGEKPNQRMTPENRKEFNRLVTQRMMKEGYEPR